MKTIRLLVDKPEFLAGSVIRVDDQSAATLIEKEEAKLYDPADGAEDAEPKAKRRRGGRGNASSVKVAEADMPEGGAADSGGDSGDAQAEGGGENV